jgi:hypothetical protein
MSEFCHCYLRMSGISLKLLTDEVNIFFRLQQNWQEQHGDLLAK